MKLLVLDYLRRHRWIFIGSFLLHILALVVSWQTPAVMIVVCVLGGSAFLLSTDLNRGGKEVTRTLLALPVSAKDIARAWRFVALEFPIYLYFVGLLISVPVSYVFTDAPEMGFQRVAIAAIFQSLFLGIEFFALTGLPARNPLWQTGRDQVNNVFFGLLWGASIPGVIFLMISMPMGFQDLRPLHIGIGAFMLLSTVAGWFRAECLVRSRCAEHGSSGRISSGRERPGIDWKKQISKFGGLRYLVFHFGRGLFAIGLVILVTNWAVMQFYIEPGSEGGSGDSPSSHSAMDLQLSFVLPIFGLVTAIILISQLRSLRALPISRVGLTHFLVLGTIAFAGLFGACAGMLYWFLFGGSIPGTGFWLSVAGMLASLVGIPLILRFGLKLPIIGGLSLLVPAFLIYQSFTESEQFSGAAPVAVAFSIAGALLVATWFLTYRLLGSSHPWRSGALKLPGQLRQN